MKKLCSRTGLALFYFGILTFINYMIKIPLSILWISLVMGIVDINVKSNNFLRVLKWPATNKEDIKTEKNTLRILIVCYLLVACYFIYPVVIHYNAGELDQVDTIDMVFCLFGIGILISCFSWFNYRKDFIRKWKSIK